MLVGYFLYRDWGIPEYSKCGSVAIYCFALHGLLSVSKCPKVSDAHLKFEISLRCLWMLHGEVTKKVSRDTRKWRAWRLAIPHIIYLLICYTTDYLGRDVITWEILINSSCDVRTVQEKSVESKKSHGDHKAIEHDLENRLAVLPIWSNILKYRISKNSVISCFQVLKSVSESKSNSWFHGVHLYDSTFNWKGLEALTKTWQKRPRSWLSETWLKLFHSLISLVGCIRKGLGPQTIWTEKGFFQIHSF